MAQAPAPRVAQSGAPRLSFSLVVQPTFLYFFRAFQRRLLTSGSVPSCPNGSSALFLPQHDCDRSHNVRIKIGESDGRAMITNSWGDNVQACKIKSDWLASLL